MTSFIYCIEMLHIIVFCLALGHALGAIPYIWRQGEHGLSTMPYLIGGEDAEDGKYPYQVSLYRHSGKQKTHECAGSILTKDWIVAPAHCCDRRGMSVLVGTNKLSEGGQVYRIFSYKRHYCYDEVLNYMNDICLVKVVTPIEFSNVVQPVTLPPQGKELQEGDLLTVTGWGYTRPNDKQTPDKMQVLRDLKYLPRKKCSNVTQTTIYDGHLCLLKSKPGQGTCTGDSGSAGVKDGVLYGFSSFFFVPCGNGLPDVFVRVSNYIDWIKSQLGPDAADLKFAI